MIVLGIFRSNFVVIIVEWIFKNIIEENDRLYISVYELDEVGNGIEFCYIWILF